MPAGDLNLMLVFQALMLDRSVSRAARRLSLSQPAVSHALARLRRDLGDPLFVRGSRGMVPTPCALRAWPQVESALALLDQAFRSDDSFAPSASRLRFVIAATDYIEWLLMPRLLATLRAVAPGVVVVVQGLGRTPIHQELERGTVDLVIGGPVGIGPLPPGLHARFLWEERYQVLLRTEHPVLATGLDLPGWLAADHVLVTLHGDLWGTVDKALAAQGSSRRVVAGCASFLTPAAIVRCSDLMVTLPARIARELASTAGLAVVDAPIPLPPFAVHAAWHARTAASAEHRWLRQRVAEALLVGGDEEHGG